VETTGRSRIARLVGLTAALNAELVIIRQGNRDRVFLKGTLQDVPPAQRSIVTNISDTTLISIKDPGMRPRRAGGG
jgi:hypothetical protein